MKTAARTYGSLCRRVDRRPPDTKTRPLTAKSLERSRREWNRDSGAEGPGSRPAAEAAGGGDRKMRRRPHISRLELHAAPFPIFSFFHFRKTPKGHADCATQTPHPAGRLLRQPAHRRSSRFARASEEKVVGGCAAPGRRRPAIRRPFPGGCFAMEFFAGYSDDTLALCGCAAAFVFCCGVMFLSRFAGRSLREADAQALPLPAKSDRDSSRKRAA